MATLTTQPRIMGPDGRPWTDDAPPGIKVPHVWTFGSLINTVSRSYDWRWDEAYRQSQENAKAMRRDCFLMGLLRERQLPTEQMRWHIEPEDKKDARQVEEAAFLEAVIRRTPFFQRYKRSLLEGAWYGRAAAQHSLMRDEVDGKPAVVIQNHLPVNGDKIQFDWDGTPKIRINMGTAQQLQEQGATVQYSDIGAVLKLDKPFWRERFCVYQHDVIDADYMDPIAAGAVGGLGIRNWVYWMDWMKKEVMSWMLDYMERTGLGLTIYYYDASNPQSEATARDQAKRDGRNTVIVWPRSTEGKDIGPGIDRIETSTQGAEVIQNMMEYFDLKIERFVIGQTMSSRQDGGGLGGSHAAKFQANTKFRIIKSDCDNLADTLTEDLVKPLKRLNPVTAASPYAPKWVFNVDEYDPEAKLNAVKTAYSIGVGFDEDEVREVTGFSKPTEDSSELRQADPMEMLEAKANLAPAEKPGDKKDDSLQHDRSGRDLYFYRDVNRERKSFLSKVIDTIKAGERRLRKAIKGFFSDVAAKVTGVLSAALSRSVGSLPTQEAGMPPAQPSEPDVSATIQKPAATEQDVEGIAATVEEAVKPEKLQEAMKPDLERLHSIGQALELDDNVRTRVGAYSGSQAWQEPFAKLKKKLPAELQNASAEFLQTSFRQPWWNKIPGELAKDVATTLQKGIKEGDSIERLLARLQNAWPDLSSKKARLIARTESTGALNAGLQAARLVQYAKGLVKGKAWQILDRINVRPTHEQAEGQTVGVTDYFEVGGEKCQHPGDQSLSPGERCNCRCIARSVPADDQPVQYSRDEGNGHWITIGGVKGEDGKRHGGSPVFIKGGRIEKGAPALEGKKVASLGKPHPDHERWTSEARRAKVSAKNLHALAADIRSHDAEFVKSKTQMLQEARKLSVGLGHANLQGFAMRGARGTLDPSKLKGFDDVAARMHDRYPEHFDSLENAESQLFDMLTAGNPKAMSHEDSYQQALDVLREQRRSRKRERDAVPFERQGEWYEKEQGHWVTIHGTHVFIEDGKVIKGPAHLLNMKQEHAERALKEAAAVANWQQKFNDAPSGVQKDFLPGSQGSLMGTQLNLFETGPVPGEHKQKPDMPGQKHFSF